LERQCLLDAKSGFGRKADQRMSPQLGEGLWPIANQFSNLAIGVALDGFLFLS
jgi:hypothetical protein